MVLDEIVWAKRDEISLAKKIVPLDLLKKRLDGAPRPRDLRVALQGRPLAIIAEIKRRSPSAGWIRQDLNPVEVAASYERAGAAAISVLTEKRFFGGHPSFLEAVRKRVSIPVLRKDFILDPYQVYESRVLGADAVLLVAALLEGGRLAEMVDLAGTLGLCPLVEVHDREELDRALAAGAEAIGINNRDLRTLTTDLGTTLQLAPLVRRDLTLVSESGIRNREDLERLLDAGVRAFLVGETLMRAQDPGVKLRELLAKENHPQPRGERWR